MLTVASVTCHEVVTCHGSLSLSHIHSQAHNFLPQERRLINTTVQLATVVSFVTALSLVTVTLLVTVLSLSTAILLVTLLSLGTLRAKACFMFYKASVPSKITFRSNGTQNIWIAFIRIAILDRETERERDP